ncbi:YfdX family protein, partial [Methylobacterium sp. E-005]|uniref:YfdX family protein n=1 Tax=Methylobacterium sp. E-005 TaxID=2836549 RepID=UPI001FBB7F1B
MSYNRSIVIALVAATALGGAAFAAEQAAAPHETPAQKAADADAGKLSKDGAQAFQDLQLTRLAIFEANPAQAKDMIGRAQAAFAKAKTDDTVFMKAEADLKSPADMAGQKGMASSATAQPAATDDKPSSNQSKNPVAWVPVDAQLTLGDEFVATPEKASAVTEANKNLAQGDQKGAMEKLKLAHVDVNFTMAVLPLN